MGWTSRRSLFVPVLFISSTQADASQVERKTHREDWTGEKSVKARFPIKEENLNAFLAGTFTMEETFENLRKRGKKSDKEVDSMIKLAREVQAAVINKGLKPGTFLFLLRSSTSR